jgi:hypothetical protein
MGRGNNGGEAAFDELDVIDTSVANFQLVAERKADRFQVRLDQFHIFTQEAREQTIGRWVFR